MSTKKTTKTRMTEEEKKAAEEAERLEIETDALADIDEALPLAVRLFGADVSATTVIAVSQLMFDEDGDVDEDALTDDIESAKKLAHGFFDTKGTSDSVVINVLERALVRQELDEGLDDFIRDVERTKKVAVEKFGESSGSDPLLVLALYDRTVYIPGEDE
jgi:hypothetical protein